MDVRNAAGVPLTFRGFLWSKLLDTLAGAAAADGDIIYRAAGAWSRLPIGTSGRLLKAAGGLPTWGALPAIYQENDLVISDATTGSTFVDTELVASLAPGTYRFEIQNFAVSHATPDFKSRLHFTGTFSTLKYLQTNIVEGATGYGNSIEEAFDITLLNTSTANVLVSYYGTVVVTGAGDLSYQVGQNVASPTAITAALSGGSMLLWGIA